MNILLFFVAALVCGATATPTCRSNEGRPGRFPTWPATYDMQSSTIIQPCNMSGFLEPVEFYAQFGIVDIDWSNLKNSPDHQGWADSLPMSCEELLVQQAALLKAARPEVRVFVYRNIVKALPWFTSVREKLQDPAYSGFFLHFKENGYFPNGTYHVPNCDKNWPNSSLCSTYYLDQEQTPGYPHGDGNCPGPCNCGTEQSPLMCGEYLFDWRNGSMLSDFIINDFIMGPTGIGNGNITGFYLDDEWYNTSTYPSGCSGSPVGGPTEEDPNCLLDILGDDTDLNFTTSITDSWCETRQNIEATLIENQAWMWQMFSNAQTPPASSCATTIRGWCEAGTNSTFYNSTTYHAFTITNKGNPANLTNFDQDLSTFLLARGDYAYLGYAWQGCSTPVAFPDALKADYGVPTGLCAETAPNSGVFTREWSKATVQMDCNAYVGTVTMH